MEADVRRFYPGTNPANLSWVKLCWLIRYLPRESVYGGLDGWSQGDLLLSDHVFIQTGKHHPDDPRVKADRKKAALRLKPAADRAARRREQLGIIGSVLRKKKAG